MLEEELWAGVGSNGKEETRSLDALHSGSKRLPNTFNEHVLRLGARH